MKQTSYQSLLIKGEYWPRGSASMSSVVTISPKPVRSRSYYNDNTDHPMCHAEDDKGRQSRYRDRSGAAFSRSNGKIKPGPKPKRSGLWLIGQ